jgi:small subunit ribosomal protein S6
LPGLRVRAAEPEGGKTLKRYDLVFITLADLPNEDIDAIVDRYASIIKNMKGAVIRVNRWGKRKLAYLIGKQSRGNYVMVDFAGTGSIVSELERNLKFDEKIIKYMTVKQADSITPEEIERAISGTPAETEEKPAEAADQEGRPRFAERKDFSRSIVRRPRKPREEPKESEKGGRESK